LLFWGVLAAGSPLWAPLLIGIVFCALASVMLIVAAVDRLRANALRQGLSRYACERCGYVPNAGELEEGQALPCHRCGRPVYSNR